MKSHVLLDSHQVIMMLNRMIMQLIEYYSDVQSIVFVGIDKGGNALVNECIRLYNDMGYKKPSLCKVDLKMVTSKDIDHAIVNRHVVLVGDVVYSGKRMLQVIHDVIQLAMPSSLRCMCLVDRVGRSYPVHIAIKGLTCYTKLNEYIDVVMDKERIERVELKFLK